MDNAGRLRTIRVVEPQVQDLSHSPFNAALLHAVGLAFPDQRVSFSAMPRQLEAVQGILAHHAPGLAAEVEWETLEGPPSGAQRDWWRYNARLLTRLLNENERVLFASLSRMQLFQTKWLMRTRPRVNVCSVLHGDLEELANPRNDRFPLSLISLPNLLRASAPKRLRYLVLGRSIYENIPAEYGELKAHAGVMDHPYHFPQDPPKRASEVRIGIFGNTGEGREVGEVAAAVKALRPQASFTLVGAVRDQETIDRLSPLMSGARILPIPREEYEALGRGITHALWLTKPGGFRLRASGTFFDALAFTTPLVYTDNPYISAYRAEAPEIGWPCRDSDEVVRQIVRIVDDFDPDEHRRREEAMRRFRERFSPGCLVPALREATGWR